MTDIDVAVLLGSLRADSINLGMARALAAVAPDGVRVTIVDGLAEVPFYNEDIDNGSVPSAARNLRERVAAADRLIAVTPEYNGSTPAVLKNAIDWVSKPYGEGAITGKPFAVVGAAPTPYGAKWSHEATARSAEIAGARIVPDATLSQSATDVDVATDPDVRAALRVILDRLVAFESGASDVAHEEEAVRDSA
ncbi:NAD(P)H-dependent oxidoreductase [Nocardioides sp. NPDC006273]|uniref:NADPH-dependent FMN reductase n=1 Tax=Nocardioides sp. NPDC006273 TaxID=3155598 RepID=UPI0033BE6DDE